MYSFAMDIQALTNPYFLGIVAIIVVAWKAGSMFDRWHKEYVQEHRSDGHRRAV